MVGLGRMGENLVHRLQLAGHRCIGFDRNPEKVARVEGFGATGASTIEEMVDAFEGRRAVWVMVPAAVAGDVVRQVAALLSPGDIVIDGGNSNWQDDVDLGEELAPTGIHFMDIGTSGGVHGLERGFSLMIGGDDDAVAHLQPAFEALAPGIEAAERTNQGPIRPGEAGWLHCGPVGSGHFVKMIHNGIEYGMMAAIAEGLSVLEQADRGRVEMAKDAETTPMRDAKYYEYDIDVAAVAEVWRRGSVIASWLVDLTAEALAEEGDLDSYAGHVSDSGEGRWTAQAAIDLAVPAPVINASLTSRFASRGRDLFANKVLSAMRAGFGGHREKKPASE
ncbi:MAG: phosphogluconate dehydrogenase (NAD(+)-dependent, decarboxylating) [Actinomycetota bacterium]